VAQGRLGSATIAKHSGVTTLQGSKIKVTASDAGVKLNDSNVIIADVRTSNGVIHAIDAVMLPPGDIIATATAAGNFKTLLAALDAAGLTEAVRTGKLTVFAPTDDAFAKLPAGTVETLLKPENKAQLVSILTYHVVNRQLDANQVRRNRALRTLQGQTVRISRDAEGLNVNDANIVAADIYAANGVIHVIDSVILPR
jgi:transforming growth factor-beta-induced protein